MSSKNGRFTLAGISSFGKDCEFSSEANRVKLDYADYEASPEVDGDEPIFGIYTNVPMYTDWIKQNSDYIECELSKFT